MGTGDASGLDMAGLWLRLCAGFSCDPIPRGRRSGRVEHDAEGWLWSRDEEVAMSWSKRAERRIDK